MFDEALRALSEAYRRVHDEADQEEQKSWVPPDTFQRQTMKFWVQLEDAIALKVEILKRLPIVVPRLGKIFAAHHVRVSGKRGL